jgi:Cytochrome P450
VHGQDDYLQWQIHLSLSQPEPRESKTEIIAARVNSVNFAAIHTNVIMTESALLDLYSTPPEKCYVESIREEIIRVLEEEGGEFTKAGLARMVKLESAVKETMRWRGSAPLMLPRKASALAIFPIVLLYHSTLSSPLPDD